MELVIPHFKRPLLFTPFDSIAPLASADGAMRLQGFSSSFPCKKLFSENFFFVVRNENAHTNV